jgi:hypothetical protein
VAPSVKSSNGAKESKNEPDTGAKHVEKPFAHAQKQFDIKPE